MNYKILSYLGKINYLQNITTIINFDYRKYLIYYFYNRVRLNIEKFVVQNEILLLEPVSFTLLIKRNLSSAWFTSIPDIDMSGRLNKINILISKEDYITAMKVLEKNLGETVEDKKFTASVNKKKVEIEVLHHRPGRYE